MPNLTNEQIDELVARNAIDSQTADMMKAQNAPLPVSQPAQPPPGNYPALSEYEGITPVIQTPNQSFIPVSRQNGIDLPFATANSEPLQESILPVQLHSPSPNPSPSPSPNPSPNLSVQPQRTAFAGAQLKDPSAEIAESLKGSLNTAQELQGRSNENERARYNELVVQANLEEKRAQEQAEKERFVAEQERAESKAYVNKMTKEAEELANTKIDQNRVWNEKSTGDKIIAAFSYMILGALSGAAGKPEIAINLVNSEINKDIDAQKAAIENKKAGLQAKQNVYGRMLDFYKDSRAARLATEKYSLEFAQKTASRINISHDNIKGQLEGEKIINQLEDKKKQVDNELKQHLYEVYLAKRKAAAAAIERAKQKDWERQKDVITLNQNQQKIDIDRQKAGGEVGEKTVYLTNSTGKQQAFKVNTPKDAEEVKTATIAYSGMLDNLNQIQSLRSGHAAGSMNKYWDTKDYEKAQALHEDLFRQATTLVNLGVLSDNEREVLKDMVGGDPTKWSTFGLIDQKLNAFKAIVARNYKNTLTTRVPGYSASQPITTKPGN